MHITTRETKRKGKRWICSARDPESSQHKKTFSSEKEARLWGAEIEAGKHQVRLGELTLLDLANEWWGIYAEHELTALSQKQKRWVLRCYLMPAFENRIISSITPLELEQWSVGVRNHLSDSSHSFVIVTLKQILRWGLDRGMISSNPASILRSKRECKPFTYWDKNEASSFLESSKDGIFAPLWRILLYTGCRIGEALGLNHEHIHLGLGKIHFGQHLLPNGELAQGTKSGTGRWIPIPPVLRPIFVQLLQGPGPHLLCGRAGNRIHYKSPHAAFVRACSGSGVRKIRIHDLRHTYASHFVMGGGDLFVLQKLLGHSSITMTERYAHLSPDHLALSASIVDYGEEFLRVVESA